MTPSQSRNSADRVHRPSTGHGTVRSSTLLSSQIAGQFAAVNAICRSFIYRFNIGQPAGSVSSLSHSSPAALKSP
jgi:hypothetical protein